MVSRRITGLMAAGAATIFVAWGGPAAMASDGDSGDTFAAQGSDGLLANLLPSQDNVFSAVSGAFVEDWDAGEVDTSDDVAVVHVMSDGDGGFVVTVVDRVNDVRRTVYFPADSFVPFDDGGGNGRYMTHVTEGLNSYRFALYSWQSDFHDAERTDGSPWHDYATVFELQERNSGLRAFFAFGAKTPAGGLPYAGTAIYRGWLKVHSSATDLSENYRYGGDLRLEADFGDGSVSGTVDDMESEASSSDWIRSDMPDGNRMDILNGMIADGRLTADWEGHGPEGGPADTMRGFSGTVTAVFHGPAAEELAGVLQGRREATDDAPAQVAIGEFVAEGEGVFETVRYPDGPNAAPVYAASGAAGLLARLLPSGDNVFSAVSGALVEDRDAGAATSDDVAVVHVASDGNGGFRVTVVDRVNDVRRTVHFPAGSFVPFDDGGGKYEVNVTEGLNSYRFRLYSRKGDFHDAERTDGSPWHDYATVFELVEDNSGLRAYFTFGARTPAGGLPYAGTAVYRGWLNFRSVAVDLSQEHHYGGDLRLEADFGDGSVSGTVGNMQSESRDSGWVSSDMPDGNRLDILNGRIADGGLTADWQGHGPEGGLLDTLRGFSGTVAAVFHGPAAEELAGVLEGRREATDDTPAQVTLGEFVAGRGDVEVPGGDAADGLLGSLLPSGNHAFPAVSSALVRDRGAGEAAASDDLAVVHVASDGDVGFRVTILNAASAVQRTVHFPADSFVPYDGGGGRYEVALTEGLNSYRFRLYDRKGDFDDAERTDGSPDYDYATVLDLEERNSGLRAWFAFGTGTPAGGMPNAGTAVYRGWLSVRAYAADLSEEYWYGGSLRLDADFADGSVSGTVDDDWRSRTGDGSYADMADGNRVDILNGRIADGRLTADWEGHGPEGGPLDTMRGFVGTVTAVFHGPAAQELAGVLQGRREATGDAPAQVAIGEFVAEGEGLFDTVSDFVGPNLAPVYAASGPAGLLANLLPSGDNVFPAVSSGLFADYGEDVAVAADDIAVVHVASDGDNGFMVTVLDRTDGRKITVHFTADSFVPDDDGVGGRYEVEYSDDLDSFRFRLYDRKGDFGDAERTDGSPDYDYATIFELYERNYGLEVHFAFGARTPAGGLPYAGSAVYQGSLRIEAAPTDLSDWYRYDGDLRLETDFADGSVSGTVDEMQSSSQGGGWAWSALPDGNRIDILNGRIADGRLAADWEGHGPEGEPADTMRGFAGTITAVFHGPAAEELAGVLQGRREATDDVPAQVAIGEFVAERGDVEVPQAMPRDGLLGSLLPFGNHTFPAVSSSLVEDYDDDEAFAVDGFVVQHVASDGNGGFRVTILGTDDAVQRTVHFPADSFVPYDDEGGEYEVELSEGLYNYRFRLKDRKDDFEGAEKTAGSPWSAYATVFELEERNSGLKTWVAFGPRTPEGGMPNAGTALYRGGLSVRAYAADLSEQYRYRGDLRLEAEFAEGSVSGTVDDMRSRISGGSYADMPDGNRMDILNGRIADGQLAADWEGHGPEGAPLDTMRGFAGTMTAAFHGPEAEELAGVVEGRREATDGAPAQVAIGEFLADRVDGVFVYVSDAEANTLDPVRAEAGAASLWDSSGVELGVDSVSRLRDFRNLREMITEPVAGSAEVRSVRPDGDGSGGYTVTYVINGSEHDIHFGRNEDGSHDSVTSDGVEYQFWNGGPDGEYRDSFYAGASELHCDDCYFGTFLSTGLETDPDVLRTLGSADYEGTFWANLYPEDRASSRNWREIQGDLDLRADFSGSRISGQVDGIEMRDSEVENPNRDWAALPENGIAILDGRIDGSRFQANWEGMDSDAASDPDRSLRGFAGGIAGAFYGPAGEELGGVVGGGRDAVGASPAWHVMGFIGGTKASGE